METTTELIDDLGRNTPPPLVEGDVEADMAKLRAIAAHPKASDFLAELAAGGDESELLRKYFPRQPAMYQSAADPEPSAPCGFLSHFSRSFWD